MCGGVCGGVCGGASGGARQTSNQSSLIPSLSCADKPFLLAGLLLLYGMYQKCCGHDASDSNSMTANMFSALSTDLGMICAFLVLMMAAAIADAVAEVEAEVREQERLRLK